MPSESEPCCALPPSPPGLPAHYQSIPSSRVSTCITPVLPTHLTTLFLRRHHSRRGNISPNIQPFSVNHCICFNNPDLTTILTAEILTALTMNCSHTRQVFPNFKQIKAESLSCSRGQASVSVPCWGGRDEPPGQPCLSPANHDQWHIGREEAF